MKKLDRSALGGAAALFLFATAGMAAPTPEVVKLWPGQPPGTESWTGAEIDRPAAAPGGPPPAMITNVTIPTLTVYRPAAGRSTGAAVIVAPGGGFQALAFNHEGAMVGEWLAERGITAFVLKYRVRMTPGFKLVPDARHHVEDFDAAANQLEAGRRIAVADGVEAVRYVRAHAAQYGVRPDRVGFMGFSAGGMTTMGVVMDSAPADRPDFAAPIYGTMEEDKAPPKGGPPLFIVAAQDDPTVPVQESVAIFSRWTAADLPAELHIYETGGHGFGMQRRRKRTDEWTEPFDAWLRSHGWSVVAAPSQP
jgi:acetyl esterase/lipase